jgi:hypothetical protein
MPHPQIPLLTLADGHAPYKGTWQLVQQAPHELEAIHTTYHREDGPGCVIERLSFVKQDLARQFVRHLLLHNWSLRRLHQAGEGFWVGLPA